MVFIRITTTMLDIVGKRKIWFTISGLLVLGGILPLIFWSPNFGIDFTGGTAIEYRFLGQRPSGLAMDELLQQVETGKFPFAKAEVKTGDVGAGAAEASDATVFTPPQPFSLGKPIIQPVGNQNLLVKVHVLEGNQQKAVTLAVKQQFGQEVEEVRSETIGPVVGRNLRKNAVLAVILASVLIILYIAFAFRKIPRSLSPVRFGVVAVIALIHDVLTPIGVFMFLGHFWGVEIDSLFVTALLTVMGFSVHDTIVVFDRIRENLIRAKHQDFAQIANDSVNQTMGRSINTSLTTLITLSALFFFGGDSIRWFVLTMMIGIVVGTYSSIFLATPLLVVWRQALLRKGKNA